MRIEPIDFNHANAFMERKKTIEKVNEIVDYINTQTVNPINKIPLELTEKQSTNDEYYYEFSNEIKNGDIIYIFGRDKRNGYNTVNFNVSFVYDDFITVRTISPHEPEMETDTTNGLYINVYKVVFTNTDSGYYPYGIRLLNDTLSFKSISVNAFTSNNLTHNYEIKGFIIRGVE